MKTISKWTGVLGLAFGCALGASVAGAQEIKRELTPLFDNCGDPSLANALKNGITLGISASPPYSFIDPSSSKAQGIDVEINEAALQWIGITKINYEVMPFGQLIPAMLSKRIDIVAANIHATAERLKVVSFTGPAWWYGPGIVVAKGNPANIKSFDDLKGKKVGAVAGSAADEYLPKIGAEVVPFQTDAEEFSAIGSGRVDVLMEDNTKVSAFIQANPNVAIQLVPNVAIPEELIFQYGYGYARYAVRKEDCTLRSAYTQALAEVRGTGQVLATLKKYGLSSANLFYFPM